jgi:hypothetical protein
VVQAAAGGFGAGAIDGRFAFLDVLDFAVFIDHKRGSIGDANLGDQDPVIFRYLPF